MMQPSSSTASPEVCPPLRYQQTTTPVLVLRPSSGWASLKLSELWQYRELVYFLTWREVKVRYKQTVLGAAWALIQPLFTMLIFSLFFGRLGKMPSDHIPYPVFSLTGLVPWTFFANGLAQSSTSLVTNSNLLTKVYFPRLAIPVSAVLSGIVDFAVSLVLLVGMMAFYHLAPTGQIAFVPLFLVLALSTALGVGFWLSALNVEYRDVRYTIPFLTQFWMFATPIAYPSSLLHDPWKSVYGLNPMVGVVEGFRWALLGSGPAPTNLLTASSSAALVILVTGAYYFRRMEKGFGDIV